MNQNQRNHKNDRDENVDGLRKITYWEKYGVKSFPYTGRRRFKPLVYQSEDGGIIISNDVFGLTIKQFERTYKSCLGRRKAHKQYILNLRYPDKTSDKYLEYLQIVTDCNEDYRCRFENDMKEQYLYEYLLNAVGTEMDIRKRQQLFILRDKLYNTVQSDVAMISSGSLAEGLDLPGSDIDIMYVIKNVDVIQDVKNIKHPLQNTTLVMETDTDHPGFTKLRLIAGGDGEIFFITHECFESTRKGIYLSVNKFVDSINQQIPHLQQSSHGPCLSDKGQHLDSAFCLQSKYLPFNATQWASRYRHQWPLNSTINKLIDYGCMFVPIGPRTKPDCNVLWRVSFSMSEKHLVQTFNHTQLLCYGLLKLTLKHRVNKHKNVDGLLCSYFLKTALFWVSEEEDIDTFKLSRLFYCFTQCIKKLIVWVKNCFCPNYFIPDQNMFQGKINPDNNKILINILYSIIINGIDGLIMNLYFQDIGNGRLLSTISESSFIIFDFFFYRICGLTFTAGNYRCLNALILCESIMKSKSNSFKIDACKYYHAEISQYSAQLLKSPTSNKTIETYSIRKFYHKHLQNGTKADAVTGWLLYASFYYVTGQFNVTLKLTDYVLSRCSPDMVSLGFGNDNEKDKNNYRNHVHSTVKMNDKMRIATIRDIIYLQNSSLIPGELQPDVKDQDISLSPTFMSHCLRFLCYHHLGDIFNRQQALRDLYLGVKDLNNIFTHSLSTSKTILGVCYEISGDKDTAYQCYDEALQCVGYICLSAKARKSKLLEI